MKFFAVAVILMVLSLVGGENVFLLDITPEEAQKFIDSHGLDLKYAPKINEGPVPVKEDEEGNLVYQGRKLPNPNDFVEEEYLASQFHGQDGLGRYSYGYSDWNQGKVEEKSAQGKVQGTYKYVDANGKDFVATYYADETGFHQEDNRPEVNLEPATDTPEVKAAKEEHMRLWNEAAEKGNQEAALYDGGENQQVYDNSQNRKKRQDNSNSGQYNPEEETTGEPRGFFYSFDYPVQVLRPVDETKKTKRSSDSHNLPYSTSLRAAQLGAIPVDAVHDTQVHPNQRSNLQNSQILPVDDQN